MKQRILISNDDGINAKGLKSLIEVASRFGEVLVVAPEAAMSGMSHAITMNTPLYLREVRKYDNVTEYACQGTPSDCIKIALDQILTELPTLVLSGINHGSNANVCSIYSGTIGAAMEGAMNKIPSIGFSLDSHDSNADFTACKRIAHTVIERILESDKSENICLNVNIPNIPYEEIKGIVPCRQSMGMWKERFIKHYNPRGAEYFWLTGEYIPYDNELKDDDQYLLEGGYATVVPIQHDLTDYDRLTEVKEWFKG